MKRIQRKRTRGYKMPENTKYVGRPTVWGNPFLTEKLGAEEAARRYRECILNNSIVYVYIDEVEASVQYERFKWIAENLNALSKYENLACFCPLESPCHADVLIELSHKQLLGF